MTIRPIYMPSYRHPYCDVWNAQLMQFVPNTTKERAQRNIQEVFRVFQKRFPDKKILEVSLFSPQIPLGTDLCPQFLCKKMESLDGMIPVESILHASKIFTGGGPYTDLFTANPLEIKNDPRLRSSGILTSYTFEGEEYPIHPRTAFFDFIYMLALVEPQNHALTRELLQYDAFCDITYQETKDFVCPARSLTIFVSLMRQGLLQKVHTFEEYLTVVTGSNEKHTVTHVAQASAFSVGDIVVHPSWGKGKIITTEPKLVIRFPSVGEKSMNPAFVKENCQVISCEEQG